MDSRRGGYTLIEVLAVLAIIGIAIALAQIHFARSPAQALEHEGHRLALVLELARDEAMMQGCTVAWRSSTDSHRLECRRAQTDYVAHPWAQGVTLERVSIAGVPVARESLLLFTPSGINAPFELMLALEGHRVHVTGDALGRVSVSR
jgi:general secretion pathway protein H